MEKYQDLIGRLSHEEFSRLHAGFYLLGLVSDDTPDGELDFFTGIVRVGEDPGVAVNIKNPRRSVIKPGEFVVKIAKKTSSAWQHWYSVGRTTNNDIVLRHPSVSKLHARLDTQGPIETQSIRYDSLWITDLNSKKGTTLNEKSIESSKRYPVQIGDQIRFGEVETVLSDAGLLHDRLSERFI